MRISEFDRLFSAHVTPCITKLRTLIFAEAERRKRAIRKPMLAVAAGIVALSVIDTSALSADATLDRAALGKALFFDPGLSANGTVSCATCHDPSRAFSDGRRNEARGAVSMGANPHSVGRRNTPALTYAYFVPEFHRDKNREYVGGFFYDGRASSLDLQAVGPLLNETEMALPDAAAIVERVLDNAVYAEALVQHFGRDVLENEQQTLQAVSGSLAAFERTELFAAFDSRYDRFLRGEYELSASEELGRLLFFSKLINCAQCHQANEREFARHETFTNNRYYNIGVPANPEIDQAHGAPVMRDAGLAENPAVDDAIQAGKFRVPGLRNVAVTAPYMHNGVFQELATVIRFYNHFIVRNQATMTNPETGAAWPQPEIPENLALDLLRQGQPLGDEWVEAIAAFLATLTDRRYEPLLVHGDTLP